MWKHTPYTNDRNRRSLKNAINQLITEITVSRNCSTIRFDDDYASNQAIPWPSKCRQGNKHALSESKTVRLGKSIACDSQLIEMGSENRSNRACSHFVRNYGQ
jgi:hypothetical protein